MKYLLFVFTFLMFSNGIEAQERYFQNLEGIESESETILFYQMREIENFEEYRNLATDYLYRFETNIQKESLLADFGYFIYALEGVSVNFLEGFKPISKEQVFIQSSFADDDFIGVAFSDIKADFSVFSQFLNLTNINFANNDSVFVTVDYYSTAKVPLDETNAIDTTLFKNIEPYDYFYENIHSYNILDISPFQDSVGFIIDETGFAKSEDLFNSFTPIDFSAFDNVDFSKTTNRFLFDNDSLHIYSLIQNKLLLSDDFGNNGSWKENNLSEVFKNPSHLTIDTKTSGSLFLADSNSVYQSSDYGNNFELLLDFDSEITGLYKKPDSDILYVLTRTDLYELKNGQPTSIKQVPVSSETEPDIPEQITLHQNYPNPFNPSTTIQFDLKESAFTKLTVYDLLGRKVRELVNEVRPAGTNSIQFNASDLASGVYLYRLEAGNIVQTKRLTLIK